MPGNEQFKITVKNQLSEIERFQSEFAAFASQQGLATTTKQKLQVAFEDLLANIIFYAYTDSKDHDIEIAIDASAEGLKITVVDDGFAFNPLEAEKPDTSLALEEREIGGLGIHLVVNIMDIVTYERRDNRNVVVLTKWLD